MIAHKVTDERRRMAVAAVTALVASSVLWLRELAKLVQRSFYRSNTGRALRVESA